VLETIVPISARLIANMASMKFKGEEVECIRQGLAAQVEEQQ